MYIVKRIVGKNTDYLSDWDAQWGTACRGSINFAMKFETLADAEAAAEYAQSVCRGVDGPAIGVTFKAIHKPDLV